MKKKLKSEIRKNFEKIAGSSMIEKLLNRIKQDSCPSGNFPPPVYPLGHTFTNMLTH